MQGGRDHWTGVYEEKSPTDVSWYQPEPKSSLRALDRFGARSSASFIDVGGGASTLVDALLDSGWRDVTVLDIAASALKAAKDRLGEHAAKVHWEVADITQWQPSRRYDVWHDRAVFHFLTQREQRTTYIRQVTSAVKPGGHILIGTFGLEGPERCSGLDVMRYDAESLHREFGSSFHLLESFHELHETPFGTTQQFLYCSFVRA